MTSKPQDCRVTTVAGRKKGMASNRGRVDRSAHFLVASSVTRLHQALRQRVFDPAVTSILEDAFEDAWRRVVASNAPYAHQEYVAAGRAILAT
jgi:hypothetical protein